VVDGRVYEAWIDRRGRLRMNSTTWIRSTAIMTSQSKAGSVLVLSPLVGPYTFAVVVGWCVMGRVRVGRSARRGGMNVDRY
jgi:hypothetical protein